MEGDAKERSSKSSGNDRNPNIRLLDKIVRISFRWMPLLADRKSQDVASGDVLVFDHALALGGKADGDKDVEAR